MRVSATGAQAEFYADPFVVNGANEARLLERLMQWRKPARRAARTADPGLGRILRDLDYPEPIAQLAHRSQRV